MHISIFLSTSYLESNQKPVQCVCMYMCTQASVGSIGYSQEVVARLNLLSLFLNQISESETCRTGHHFLRPNIQTHMFMHTRMHTHAAILTQTSTKCDCCARDRKSLCNAHLLIMHYTSFVCVCVYACVTGCFHVRAPVCSFVWPADAIGPSHWQKGRKWTVSHADSNWTQLAPRSDKILHVIFLRM